jgi:hypothetical protein
MPEFVAVRQGDEIATVERSRAERLDMQIVEDARAVDRAGRPLGPRPAAGVDTSDTTVAGILEAVGNDPQLAQAALEAENSKSKPRTTLVTQLTTIAEGGTQ